MSRGLTWPSQLSNRDGGIRRLGQGRLTKLFGRPPKGGAGLGRKVDADLDELFSVLSAGVGITSVAYIACRSAVVLRVMRVARVEHMAVVAHRR